MADDNQYITVPKGLSAEVTAYLQAMQNVVMDLAGYRNVDRRAVRLGEALRMLNEGKLWPEATPGNAKHGETVRLGRYTGKPVVIVCGMEIPCLEGGVMSARIRQLRPESEGWVFEAEAVCARGEELACGSLEWLAIGGRPNA